LTDAASTPVPHYDTKEGDTYIYTGILNDSEGKPSTNIILSYRFLGRKGDVYRLQAVNDYGTPTRVVECSVPCRVVKNIGMDGTISRQVVNDGSIVAVAMQDAANGLLGPAKAP
jgi:hypothetical protein